MSQAMGSLEQELEDVERVWMICSTGNTLTAANREVFRKIDRIIIPDVENAPIPSFMEMHTDHPGLKLNLKELAFKLGTSTAKTDVRWHPYPPFNLIIGNPESKKAWMRLELLLPYSSASSRPSIIIRKRERPELFVSFMGMFEECWKHSNDHGAETGPTP